MKSSIISGVEYFKDIFFPQQLYCICCSSFIGENNRYALCSECFSKICWNIDMTCIKCGKKLKESNAQLKCKDCIKTERNFDKGFVCCLYNLLERRIISNFKTKKKYWIGIKLAEIFYDKIGKDIEEIDIITFVPIHKKKEKKRGFNQSQVVALYLSKLTDKRMEKLIVRKKNTKPMKSLDKMERQANILGAFEIVDSSKGHIKGKNILLIDDIFTTGFTIDECSKVLKESGAKKIYVLTFGAGI